MTQPVHGRSGSSYSSSYAPPRHGDQPTSDDVHRFNENLNQGVLGGRATGQYGLAPTQASASVAGYEAQGGTAQARYRQAVQEVSDGTMSSGQASRVYGIGSRDQRQALAQLSNGELSQRAAMQVQAAAPGRAETRVPYAPTTAASYGSSPYQQSSSQQPAYPATSYQPSSGYDSDSSTAAQPPSTQRPSSSASDYASDFFTQAQDPTRFAPRPYLPGQRPPGS